MILFEEGDLRLDRWKVGIIGGAGYVGSALAGYLAKKEFDVKVVDRAPVSIQLEGCAEWQKCDIRQYDEVKKALQDVDLAIHTAIVQIPLINDEKRLGFEVNLVGACNVCKVVDEVPSIAGLILSGSWHVFGERDWKSTIDESFGLRPDKVEARARLYALSKTAQEAIVRFYDEMSEKIYGVIRMGTVLGEGMPEKTAANIFIEKSLKGDAMTPFRHSMSRRMLYVDIEDICKAFELYARMILNSQIGKTGSSLDHVVNVFWPEFVTIMDLALMIQDIVKTETAGRLQPKIEVVETEEPVADAAHGDDEVEVDIAKAKSLLGIENLKTPRESIEKIVKGRMARRTVTSID